MKFFRKHFLNPKKAFIIFIIIIVLIITTSVFVIIYSSNIYSDSAIALRHFQNIDVYNIPADLTINYTLSNFYEYCDGQIYTDTGIVGNSYDQYNILLVVKSLKITKDHDWDYLDGFAGGGVSLNISINYPDGTTLLIETNLKASRFTLSDSDGSIFKESCTLDISRLAVFLLAHDARE